MINSGRVLSKFEQETYGEGKGPMNIDELRKISSERKQAIETERKKRQSKYNTKISNTWSLYSDYISSFIQKHIQDQANNGKTMVDITFSDMSVVKFFEEHDFGYSDVFGKDNSDPNCIVFHHNNDKAILKAVKSNNDGGKIEHKIKTSRFYTIVIFDWSPKKIVPPPVPPPPKGVVPLAEAVPVTKKNEHVLLAEIVPKSKFRKLAGKCFYLF